MLETTNNNKKNSPPFYYYPPCGLLKMLPQSNKSIPFFAAWAFISFACSLLPVQSTTQQQRSVSETNKDRKYERTSPLSATVSDIESLDIPERMLGNTKKSYGYGSGSASKIDCSSGDDDGCGGTTSTDDFLSGSQSNRWYRLLLIAQVASPNFIIPMQQGGSSPGIGYLIGNILMQNNQMINSSGNQVGTMKMTCIRTTNFICTWTIFSARLGSEGCTFTAQGLFLPGGLANFENIPVVQYVAITGGTGQCRGITGEIKISPNQLQAVPQTWNYEVFYNIVT